MLGNHSYHSLSKHKYSQFILSVIQWVASLHQVCLPALFLVVLLTVSHVSLGRDVSARFIPSSAGMSNVPEAFSENPRLCVSYLAVCVVSL